MESLRPGSGGGRDRCRWRRLHWWRWLHWRRCRGFGHLSRLSRCWRRCLLDRLGHLGHWHNLRDLRYRGRHKLVAQVHDKAVARNVDGQVLTRLRVTNPVTAITHAEGHIGGRIDLDCTIAAWHRLATFEPDVDRAAVTAVNDSLELRVYPPVALNNCPAHGTNVRETLQDARLPRKIPAGIACCGERRLAPRLCTCAGARKHQKKANGNVTHIPSLLRCVVGQLYVAIQPITMLRVLLRIVKFTQPESNQRRRIVVSALVGAYVLSTCRTSSASPGASNQVSR